MSLMYYVGKLKRKCEVRDKVCNVYVYLRG